MAPTLSALDSGNPDGEDESRKASRLAARAARFNNKLPGNRYKELEELRAKERKAFEEQGLIKVGKTELDDAVDMKGTCQSMCSEYEREFREYTREIHPFERGPNGRMDPAKAVAAYTRSDAGAGHGEAAKLPSDLRTPQTLVRALDYLFSDIMTLQPASTSSHPPSARRALGYSAGFIRDRTRAIRKEFAMQSSWGHEEAIESFERIARWHILCLRELQEESGSNLDMHIDSAELGRCFTSLRQQYNDRREETGLEMPCPNEPEFRAYMLIYDLTQKSVAILTAELPSVILDHPLVKLAWQIRQTAQRNFDTQKEGSKQNAQLGENLITRFVKLLKQDKVPFLFSCLVEIRLREIRRSALRALQRTYPALKTDPIVYRDGQISERRMVLMSSLDRLLGCEPQEDEPSAFDDIIEIPRDPDTEAANVVKRFDFAVYPEQGAPMGALINKGAYFNNNEDAPFTRRWKSITDKRSDLSFVDIVNGQTGIHIDGAAVPKPSAVPVKAAQPAPSFSTSAFGFPSAPAGPSKAPSFTFNKPTEPPKSQPTKATFSFDFGAKSAPAPTPAPSIVETKPAPVASPATQVEKESPLPKKSFFDFALKKQAAATEEKPAEPTLPSKPAFSFGLPKAADSPAPASASPKPAAEAAQPAPGVPNFFNMPAAGTLKSAAAPVRPSPLAQEISPTPTTSQSTPVVSPKIETQQPLRVSRSRPPGITEGERQRRRAALPDMADELINDVIRAFFEDISSELMAVVKSESAARQYSLAKRQRREGIEWAASTAVDEMLRGVLKEVSREAVLGEIKRRYLVRGSISHWKTWAKRKREDREISAKQREDAFLRLTRMGLGGDAGSGIVLEHESRAPTVEVDDMIVDVDLREQARMTEQFYAPSTFLSVIARCIGPLLHDHESAKEDRDEDDFILWNTVFSPATDAATPADGQAQQWLVHKLTYADGEFDRFGVTFDTSVVGRYDEAKVSKSTGLVVFEAPLQTVDDAQMEENTADAQDRLVTLRKSCVSSSNRYDPALLIISWEGETLDEITERLDIEEDLASFRRVDVLALDNEDPDRALESVLDRLYKGFEPKERVVLSLDVVVDLVRDAVARFIAVASVVIGSQPQNPQVAYSVFSAGIELLSALAVSCEAVLGKAKRCSSTDFDPIRFGKPSAIEVKDLPAAADAIATFLGQGAFESMDTVAIHLSPLRNAAASSEPLPISSILSSIASVYLDDLSCQFIALQTFLPHDEAFRKANAYAEAAAAQFGAKVDDTIASITSLSAESSPKRAPLLPAHTVPAQPSSPPDTRGTKRSRASDGSTGTVTETKAAKNARLLRAMEAVQYTFDRIGDGWDSDSVLV